HSSVDSHARAFGRLSDEHLDAGTEHQNTNARTARFGGRWTLTRPSARLDLQYFGESQRLREERPRVAADRSSALTASRHEIPWTTHGAHGSVRLRPVRVLGLDH